MPFLAPVLLTTLLTFGAPEAACPRLAAPPSVRVNVEISQPPIDHRYPRAQLKTFDHNTVMPYGDNVNVHINGLMRGEYKLYTNTLLGSNNMPHRNLNCTWFNRVEISLFFKPVIYVAQEIPADTCLYREVLNHEYRHYATDYEITANYQRIFENEIGQFLAQSQVIGPYTAEKQQDVTDMLMHQIDTRTQSILNRMKTERLRRQATIDTLEEYERIMRACPPQPEYRM